MRVILGSSSPYRKKFLEEAGFEVETVSPDINEKAIRHADPTKLVRLIAEAKMDAVLEKVEGDAIVITGDQVCVCAGEISEKPETEEEVYRRYELFADHPAELVNGMVVANTRTGARASGVMNTRVIFKPIPRAQVQKMIHKGEIFRCAGGFLAEDDLTTPYIERIEGGLDGTAGMPVTFVKGLIEQVR